MEEQTKQQGKPAPSLAKKPAKPSPQQLEKGQRLKYFIDEEKIPKRSVEELDEELEEELAPKKVKAPSKNAKERLAQSKIQAGRRGERNLEDFKVLGINSKYGPVMRGRRGGTFVVINGVRYYGKYKLERARAKS